MAGALGRDWSLPLLPAGAPIFDSLPFGALVLDVLARAVGNGLITLRDGGEEGVVIVRDGVMSESVWVANGVRSTGDDALAQIRLAASSTVSACRLSDQPMGLIGPLIRSEPCYADLRLEWVAWPELLNDLCERALTFVVEFTTPTGRAVTVIEHGRQIATFAESQPAMGSSNLVDDLAAGGVGTIRVLVDRGTNSASHPGQSPVAAPTVVALTVAAAFSATPPREDEAPRINRPIVVPDDDPNATLSALFGPRSDEFDTSCRRRRSRRAPGPDPDPGRCPAAAAEAARTESPAAVVHVRRGSRGWRRDRPAECRVARRPSASHERAWFLALDLRSARGRHACIDARSGGLNDRFNDGVSHPARTVSSRSG